MRIILDDATEYQAGRSYVDITPCYAIADTIEISDAEWDEIYDGYCPVWYSNGSKYTFAQYLRELLELTALQ